jgi:hypothetical protein
MARKHPVVVADGGGLLLQRSHTPLKFGHSPVAGHEVDKVGSACNWVGAFRAGPMWPSEPTVCEAPAALATFGTIAKIRGQISEQQENG